MNRPPASVSPWSETLHLLTLVGQLPVVALASALWPGSRLTGVASVVRNVHVQ